MDRADLEMKKALEYSKDVIADSLLGSEEKLSIQEDVDHLKRSIDELKEDSVETQKRFVILSYV